MDRRPIPTLNSLDAADQFVLRWIAHAPREITDSPLGMDYSLASISRRRLLKLGLIHCDWNPPVAPLMYQITTAGLKFLAEAAALTANGGAA